MKEPFEKVMEKEENAGIRHSYLFEEGLQKAFSSGWLKNWEFVVKS